MDASIADLYSDRDRCLKEIGEARKVFGSRSTTRQEYDGMQDALGFMLLHCPEDIEYLVRATIDEATWRKPYFELTTWND